MTSETSARTPASSRTSADAIAEGLHAAGVRHAFGIPGGEVVALIDALERAGIRFHLARHENAAGFMAEAAWHATGAPAVLVATVGPGIANAVNVIANAEQDRVPLIAISGRVPEAEALTYTHQLFDHQAVLRPLVKATFEARPGACGAMTSKAIALALDPRPGPVHIDLPIPVAAAPEPRPAPPRAQMAPAAPADGSALDEARARLAAARKPVIVAGLDFLAEPEAVAPLRAFARSRGIPVLTAYKAKGLMPEDDPLSLGGHGLSPKSDALVMPFLAEADLVLALGYDPIEMRIGWRDPWAPQNCIQIAHVADRQDMHQSALAFASALAPALAALDAAPAGPDPWPNGEPARLRAALAHAFAPGEAWGPAQVLHAANRLKPAGTISTVDSGAHRILASQIWTCAEPGELLQSTGLCTMGCALPLAVGAKLARPEKPVLCIVGDGCLDMSLGELATLRDLGRPVVVLVLVDASLALIELKQRREGLQSAGVDFGRTDYAAVAQAMGGTGVSVSDLPSLEAALTEAFAADRYALIAAEIPRRSYDGLI
ncbi:MAG: thiamine pyrophosphate-binding protein [Pseudomonadota bacterium]